MEGGFVSFEVRNPEVEEKLKEIGRELKASMPAGYGFTLLITSYGEGGALFYMSSCERDSMIATMREFIQKHEHN
jgi:hypothetical protein